MPTIEERVAYLEGKVEEHSRTWADLKDMLIHLDAKVDRRIDALDAKVERFRDELSGRMDTLDGKVEGFRAELSSRMESLDQRLSGRMDNLDQKFSKYFLWIIGIQVSIFLAIIGSFLRH